MKIQTRKTKMIPAGVNMKRGKKQFLLLLIITASVISVDAGAATQGVQLDKANIDPGDQASLQRGARFFVDYCFNCHSLAYSRYNRIAVDLGMSEEEVANEMLFTGAKIGDTMTIALQRDDAKSFFGTPPPDLTVVSRSRGVDWLYTYLRSFYRDESRPWGVNNAVFKDVAMPHVLWELQGLQKAVYETHETEDGKTQSVFQGFKLVQQGALNTEQFDNAVRDIVNFLHYVGEPAKAKRLQLGQWVILFLVAYLVVMIFLKKEYWRDIK